ALAIQHAGTNSLTIDENGNLSTSVNISQTGATTLSTGTGTVSLNGNTSVTGSNTFTVGTGATSLGGTLGVTGNSSLATLSTSGLATLNSASITTNETIGGTLAVTSLATFNGGITLTSGQNLNLPGFTPGSLTFVNSSNQ